MSGPLVTLLQVVSFVFFARAILSWFPIGFDSPVRPVKDMVNRVTDPVLEPIRRILPPMGGFDISVLIVILAIQFLLIPLASKL